MNKYCAVIELKPDKLHEYIRLHKDIHKGPYKELLKVIRESGVKEEVIFIYKNLSIIYFEAEDLDKCYEYQKKFNIFDDWHILMIPMFELETGLIDSKKFSVTSLEKVFDLNEQLGKI